MIASWDEKDGFGQSIRDKSGEACSYQPFELLDSGVCDQRLSHDEDDWQGEHGEN